MFCFDSDGIRPRGFLRRAGIFRTVIVAVACLGAPALAVDPWPEYQRTVSRIGRTETIGPRTPTIAWSVRVDLSSSDVLYTNSAVMDRHGRVFIGHVRGIAVVDGATHEIVHQIVDRDVDATASLWNGHVLYGTALDVFHCVDTNTWEEVWSEPAAPHPNRGQVVDEDGVVYYPSQQDVLYARRVVDGSEVWTHHHYDGFNSAPALDPPDQQRGQLYIGNLDFGQWLAFRRSDAEIRWGFPLRDIPAGTSAVEDGRVCKTAHSSRKLYCMDAQTGAEIWSFPTEVTAGGGVAIRDDGVLYVNVSGGSGWLFAVTPAGNELWRYPISNQSLNQAPMIDGAGRAYFCTYWGNTEGWIHAVSAAGSELWVKKMPNMVAGTPMLAPDGTLYVMCKDKYLYALRDPVGDLDFDGDIDFADFTSFEHCMTTPRRPGTAALTAPGCELLDFDSDWDVDLVDVAQFQPAFTGDKREKRPDADSAAEEHDASPA